MTITYTWEVTGIKTKTEGANQDAVVQTYWKKIGTDANGNTGTFSGATPFSTAGMPEGTTFVPFAELTEAMVISWIQAVVVGSYEEHVNSVIAKEIEGKVNAAVDAPLPWAPAPAPTTPAAA